MKKLIILSITFMAALFAMKANAQVTPASYWSIFGGASVPTGEFGKAYYGDFLEGTIDNKAGFAKTGYTIGLDGAWYIHKTNWAIAATVSYQDQGQLSANDAHTMAAGYQDAFGVDMGAAETSNRYRNLNVLAGPQYSFFLKKFAVDLRADIGIIKSLSTPEIDVTITDDDIPYQFSQLSSKATAFAYGGSADLRYQLGKRFGLVLKESYIASPGIAITNTNRKNNAGRTDTKQPIAEAQTTLGIHFSF